MDTAGPLKAMAIEMNVILFKILLFLNKKKRKWIKQRCSMNKIADVIPDLSEDVKAPLAFYLAIILFNPV